MRLVRSIPHSSSEPVYCGVPAPLWYDVTAGVFPNENLGSQFYPDVGYRQTRAPIDGLPQGHILVNAIPADEILSSVPEDGRVVAGLKDAQNYIELKCTRQEDGWIENLAPQYPLGSLPDFDLPPIPFPSLVIAYNANGPWTVSASWSKIELAHIKSGTRTVLSWRYVPTLSDGLLQTHRISCVHGPDGTARIVACVADVSQSWDERGANLYFLEGRVSSSDVGPFCGARSHISHFRSLPGEECVFVPDNNSPPPPGQVFGNELLCEKFALTNAGTDYQIQPYDGALNSYGDIGGLETTCGETPVLDINYSVKPALYYGTPLSKKVLTAYSQQWPSWSATPQSARPTLTVQFKSYETPVGEWEIIPPEIEVSALHPQHEGDLFTGAHEKRIDTLFSGKWESHSSSGSMNRFNLSHRGTIVTSGFVYLRVTPFMSHKQGKDLFPYLFATAPQWSFPHNWRNAVAISLTVVMRFKRDPELFPVGSGWAAYGGQAGFLWMSSVPFFNAYSSHFGFLPDPARDTTGTGLYWEQGSLQTGDDGVLRFQENGAHVMYSAGYSFVNGNPVPPTGWAYVSATTQLHYVRDLYWKIKPN